MRHFFSLCVVSFIAMFLANGTIATLHQKLPQEFSRTAFLIDAAQKGIEADAVIFGNSIAMSGIDAGQLGELSNTLSLAHNMASNGQYLNESILYYPSIAPLTKLVIQMLRSTELSEPFKKIPPAVQRNFFFGGYNFDVAVEEIFNLDLGLNYAQESHSFELKNDHRGLLVNSLNTILKNGLRKDVLEREKETDLSFPNIYTKKLPEDKLQILINKYNPPNELVDFEIHAEKRDFINKAEQYFQSKGVQYVVVILPFNDRLKAYSSSYKSLVNRTISESDLPIISLIDIIPSSEFVDHCHLSKEGAGIMTTRLFQELKKEGYAF